MRPEIRRAIDQGWTPVDPMALTEYRRCFDWEKPGDEAFLDSLQREAAGWLVDNCMGPHWSEDAYGNETRIDCGNGCEY
jgi:hypothetical protein